LAARCWILPSTALIGPRSSRQHVGRNMFIRVSNFSDARANFSSTVTLLSAMIGEHLHDEARVASHSAVTIRQLDFITPQDGACSKALRSQRSRQHHRMIQDVGENEVHRGECRHAAVPKARPSISARSMYPRTQATRSRRDGRSRKGLSCATFQNGGLGMQ